MNLSLFNRLFTTIQNCIATIWNCFVDSWRRLWGNLTTRFLFILGLTIIFTTIAMYVDYETPPTEYPMIQVVNEDEQQAYLDITLEASALSGRLLQIQVNYWIDPNIIAEESQSEQNQEVRVWISKPHRETLPQGGIIATPRFGTPVSTVGESSVPVMGIMAGEPSDYPFDSYSASINVQDDFGGLPFRFNIDNHLVDFEMLSPESGGQHTANIKLKRSPEQKFMPFIPLSILLIYSSWVAYLMSTQRNRRDISLIANVALFLGIFSLRATVVPNEIPIGCKFDFALVFPILIILIGIAFIIYEHTHPRRETRPD